MNAEVNSRMFARMVLLFSTVLALYFIPYTVITDFHVLTISALLAIPIAAYRLEYRLFARRAVITLGCPQDGLAKKWFWNGALIKMANYFASLAIAILLLLLISSFEVRDWLIIIAAVLFLILAEEKVLNFTKRHTRGQFSEITQRGIIKWPVILFVVATSYAIYITNTYEMYAGKDLSILVTASFENQFHAYQSRILGFARAFISALDTVIMYFAQSYIPRISDTPTKWTLWSYLAIKSSVSVGIVIYLMFGILTLESIRQRGGWKLLGRTVFERYFTFTLIIFVAIFLYVSRINFSLQIGGINSQKIDCTEAVASFKRSAEVRKRELSIDENGLSNEVTLKIETSVDEIFAQAGPGIEKFLDWHFSVLGEYQQLGTQLLPTLEQGTARNLRKYITDEIDTELNTFSTQLDTRIVARINQSLLSEGENVFSQFNLSTCLPSLNVEAFTFDQLPVYVGQPQSVVAGGAVAAVIAKKTAAKITAKTAAKAAGKYAATFATGMTAAGLCGPFAPVCGIGAAAVTWLAMDVVIVTADELMNRDELRDDINKNLEKQKNIVKQGMIAMKRGSISTSYDVIKKRFEIPKDGV